ncbi:MAG TPA: FHA domain-containing protein [Micromonosporaceae bacterium]
MGSHAVVRPLPGPGLVARAGELLLVCAEAAEADALIDLLDDVAATGADGSVLVRRAAGLIAADLDGRFPDCALSGPSADGRLAVLVYRAATADVDTSEGRTHVSGADAITPVTRLVAGAVSAVELRVPGAGPAHPRARLDAGVLNAAGLVYAADGDSMPDSGAAAPSAVEYRPAVAPESGMVPEPGMMPEPAPVAALAQPEAEPAPLPMRPVTVAPPEPPPALSDVFAPPASANLFAAPPAPPEVSVPSEVFAPPPLAPVGFSADPLPPPVPVPFTADPPAPPPPVAFSSDPATLAPEAVPLSAYQDGATDQPAAAVFDEPRPALGVLLLDDGSSYPLDTDYVVGREPQHDPDVVAEKARTLKITDAEGVVSRRHVRIILTGRDIHLMDLGSSNGTFIDRPGDPQRHQLTPYEPTVIEPGTQVVIGRRWFRVEPPQPS